MAKNFKRVKEDFICGNCGAEIKGTGYTNHCPECLWSKHVDKDFPGDRASDCGGLMRPVDYEQKDGNWFVIHKCVECGKESKNKVDDISQINKVFN